jgi:hypothetical protein
MEWWNNGMMGWKVIFSITFDISNIPTFHYSIIPAFLLWEIESVQKMKYFLPKDYEV